MSYFSSSAKLEIHSEDCGKMNDCAIRLPSEDNKWLEFGITITTRNECYRIRRSGMRPMKDRIRQGRRIVIRGTKRLATFRLLSTMRVWQRVIVVSFPSWWRQRDSRDNSRFDASREKYRQRAHESTLSKQQWKAYRSATHICEKPFAPDASPRSLSSHW